MNTTIANNKVTPKQKLIAILNKKGGIEANRKALLNLQQFFSSEIPKPDAKQLREAAWRRK